MTIPDNNSPHQSEELHELRLLASLLPPPISLDILCTITGHKVVLILQMVEELVAAGFLSRYTEKGVGYYHLADFHTTPPSAIVKSNDELMRVAKKAITGICSYLPDNTRRCLHLAHVYQISGLPVTHFVEVVKAGHYCCNSNLLHDASLYYNIALNSAKTTTLKSLEQKSYVEAVIGLCSCKGNTLLPEIQRSFLEQALTFCSLTELWENEVKLRVLLARTFLKTVHSAEATKHLDRAWTILANHDFPHELKMQVALANSELLFWQGYINEAIERYESVIGNIEELPHDAETLKSCMRLGGIYGVAGETGRGVGLIRSVRQKASELGHQHLQQEAAIALLLVLSDAGRIEEGEVFLNEIFQTPTELLDDYILWPGYGKKTYLAYCRGEYEKASIYQKRTYQQGKALGDPQHRGPDNIEVMLGLEERGFFNPEWHFDAEAKRLIEWPDIYMKGVALRFRALKLYRNGGAVDLIKADLKEGIDLLTESGAKIELAHAQLLLARILLEEKDTKRAEKLLKSAWEVFLKVNPKLFPEDLNPYLDQTAKNALWVDSLINVGNALGSIQDREELLNQIIKQAMRIAGAERGAIFLRQNLNMEMVACRNIDASEVESTNFSVQRKLIETVLESGVEMVKGGEVCSYNDGKRFHSHGWSACFPVRFREKVIGVIFMDCELTRLQLPADEISLLRIISNQAAVALGNVKIFEEIVDLNSSLMANTNIYREEQNSNPVVTQMVGCSEPFKQLLKLIDNVAQSNTTVLITGETGVGKDLVAQALHQNSTRSSGPFIAINVASLSHELIASELFGHEKGAFTGASTTRKGRFELASDGTLFLDDIDALALDIQAKLLRILETKQFERVGGTRTLKTEFRLLAASNINIEDLVEQGLFRADLYYRLNVFPIPIKPLRQRSVDIPILVRYFLDIFGKKFGKKLETISEKDLNILKNYSWPGNIRELRHVIERAVLLSREGRLVVPPLYTSQKQIGHENIDKILPLKEMEAQHIVRALSCCHGKVSGANGAAAMLEVIPATLYSKMKRLGIKRNSYTFDSSSTKNDAGR